MALEASEFARDHGKHAPFHAALFRAYFGEARDIGQKEAHMFKAMALARQVDADLNDDELLNEMTNHR
jgi:predicted DsbA family dithiol-disulfide isomerase